MISAEAPNFISSPFEIWNAISLITNVSVAERQHWLTQRANILKLKIYVKLINENYRFSYYWKIRRMLQSRIRYLLDAIIIMKHYKEALEIKLQVGTELMCNLLMSLFLLNILDCLTTTRCHHYFWISLMVILLMVAILWHLKTMQFYIGITGQIFGGKIHSNISVDGGSNISLPYYSP